MFNRILYIDTFTLLHFPPKYTGLGCDIWFDSLGYERHCSKKTYILLRCKFGWKKIHLHRLSHKISADLRLYLNDNKNVIVSHWNKEISDVELVNLLAINNNT